MGLPDIHKVDHDGSQINDLWYDSPTKIQGQVSAMSYFATQCYRSEIYKYTFNDLMSSSGADWDQNFYWDESRNRPIAHR